MALIDTVRCYATAAGTELLGDGEFQTKDFGCRFDRFTIDAVGRLIHHARVDGTGPYCDRPAEFRDVVVPIHRDARLFGPDAAGEYRDFCARFSDGILQWVKLWDELAEEQREYTVTVES